MRSALLATRSARNSEPIGCALDGSPHVGQEAFFLNTNLTNADFSNASIGGANFRGANTTGAVF